MVTQSSAPQLYTGVTTSSTECVHDATSRGRKRTQLIIINTSASARITIVKNFGTAAAVLDAGIVLYAGGQPYGEFTDNGYECWQGPVQCIGSAAGQLSITESFEGS